jgi:hypothetical protein
MHPEKSCDHFEGVRKSPGLVVDIISGPDGSFWGNRWGKV